MPAMVDLSRFADVPEVKSLVVGDPGGLFLDGFDEPDGESVAAIMGFMSTAIRQVGDQLGLGGLRRVFLVSQSESCVITVQADSVITAYVDPSKSMAAIEKKLDTVIQG